MVYCETCAKKGIGWHTNKKNTEDRSQNTDKKNLNSEKDSMPGWYPVPEKDLPVLLPPLTDWKPEGTGKGPLAKIKDFVATKCPKCGGEASRETDVCDTFLDSAWYFLRYPSIETQNQSSKLKNEEPTTNNLQPTTFAWDPDITRKWLPVTSYIGGAEHTVLHLLYSRFTTMVLKDLGYLDFEEPYKRFFAHGLIIKEGAKMSKSRGNVVVPDEYITKYGADTLRTYLMFLGPFEMGGDFRDTGIAGMYKFLSRVYRLVIDKMEQFDNVTNTQPTTNNLQLTTSLNRLMHKTIRDVTTEIDNLRYNTAIAKIMEYVNSLTINHQPITINHIETLLLLLAPFAPHMTEELWQKYFVSSSKNQVSSIKNKDKKILNTDYLILDTDFHSIHTHPWPSFDPKMLEEGAVTIAVQINGKLRDTMTLSTEISQDQAKVESEAKSREKIVKYLENTSIRKVIYVPGKILNFVI
jgi:leucyl-tRNA synthetase